MEREYLPRIVRVRLPEELYQLVASHSSGSSQSAVVRRALRLYRAVTDELARAEPQGPRGSRHGR